MMESKEHPGTIIISRGGVETTLSPARKWAEVETAWAGVLRGEALDSRNPESKMDALQAGIRESRLRHGSLDPKVGGMAPKIIKSTK